MLNNGGNNYDWQQATAADCHHYMCNILHVTINYLQQIAAIEKITFSHLLSHSRIDIKQWMHLMESQTRSKKVCAVQLRIFVLETRMINWLDVMVPRLL